MRGIWSRIHLTSKKSRQFAGHARWLYLFRIFVVCATLSLAIVIVYYNRGDLTTLRRLSIRQALSIICIYLIHFVLSIVPHLVLIRHLGSTHFPFFKWFRIMVLSRFANCLLPQAGTAYKAVVLKREYGIAYTTYLHVYSLFAWMTTVLYLLLAAVLSTGMLFRGATYQERMLSVALYGIAFLVSAAPFVAQLIFQHWQPQSRRLLRMRNAVHALLSAMTEHGTNPRLLTVVIGFGIVCFGIWILFFHVALSGFGLQVNLASLAMFLAVWQLSGLFVVTPGNLGVQEIVYGIVGSAVGIGAAHGVLLSALIRVTQYMVIFPLGLAFGGWGMLKEKTADRRLQTADTEE